MKLYRSLGRIWTGTQADAKAAQDGADFEAIEVPTSKPELITWLNEFDVRPGEPSKEQMLVGHPDEPETPAPAPPGGIDPTQMRDAQKARFEALATKLGWTPPGEQKAAAELTVDAVEEFVGELKGTALIRILSSAIGRLGEVAGTHGWAAFTKHVYGWTPGAKSVEQGMGMLMLSAFNNFGVKTDQSDSSAA